MEPRFSASDRRSIHSQGYTPIGSNGHPQASDGYTGARLFLLFLLRTIRLSLFDRYLGNYARSLPAYQRFVPLTRKGFSGLILYFYPLVPYIKFSNSILRNLSEGPALSGLSFLPKFQLSLGQHRKKSNIIKKCFDQRIICNSISSSPYRLQKYRARRPG